MDYPELDDRVWQYLEEQGFCGTDANPATSLFEYAGLYSEKCGVAFLAQPDQLDPRINIQWLTPEEIREDARKAGPGYSGFIDEKGAGPNSLAGHIQSLMLWHGGWHVNSEMWPRLSNYTTDQLLRLLRNKCERTNE